MADNTSPGAPRVSPGRGTLAHSYAEMQRGHERPGEKLRISSYPQPKMSAIPAVLLRAWQAERALDRDDLPGHLDEVDTQHAFAALEGARRRALECGGLKSHDAQAAALLVAIDELDMLLDGGLSYGGDINKRLDRDELEPIWTARDTMVRLLDWHMTNGGGALMPIAEHMGLVMKTGGRS